MYQSMEAIAGQLDARIHVYDGRLWVDRGGGGGAGEEDAAEEDSADTAAADDDVEARTADGEIRTATISQLLVDRAQMFHSGRYICSALGASGTWTQVHILAGN